MQHISDMHSKFALRPRDVNETRTFETETKTRSLETKTETETIKNWSRDVSRMN